MRRPSREVAPTRVAETVNVDDYWKPVMQQYIPDTVEQDPNYVYRFVRTVISNGPDVTNIREYTSRGWTPATDSAGSPVNIRDTALYKLPRHIADRAAEQLRLLNLRRQNAISTSEFNAEAAPAIAAGMLRPLKVVENAVTHGPLDATE